MKIGILTYHRATNYGAVLQAYSLSHRISSDFKNCEVEIIDYSTKRARNDHLMEAFSGLLRFGPKYFFEVLKKNSMFHRFSNSLCLSSYKIVDDNVEKVFKLIDKNYDLVVVGSDAVFSWNGKKFPTAYFLNNNIKARKISYAASAHRLFYKEADREKLDYCRECLSSFDYLGVRDCETERFVSYLDTNLKTHHNCDPTFLLDLNYVKSTVDFKKLKRKLGIQSDKKTIVIMTPNEYVGKKTIEILGGDYNVVSVFVRNKNIKKFVSLLTPFEWASIFSLADLTICEYFHATILSLLNGTPTISIDTSFDDSGYEGKIKDLLITRLNLPELYINIQEINNKVDSLASHIKAVLSNDSIKERITKSIEKEKANYKSFLGEIENVISSFNNE